ncbi:MAG: SAM-dependent DNA methyltransferase [Clostridia bacterium]|nr:SAM-dependent DNA methyltransferase [Clostridia bacterium]
MKNSNYTQLSMFDIVLEQPKEEITQKFDSGKVEENLAVVSNTENNNLCPYKIPTIDEIVKLIEKSAYGTDKTRLISNVFECGAIAISNLLDLIQKAEREKRYTDIMNNYKPEDRNSLCNIFSKIYALCSSVVYDDGVFKDYLGELFIRLNQGNSHTGQFFTPFHISKFMAECALLPDIVKEKTKDDGILTISDPCSGGGGMMVAALSVLKECGINYGRNCFVACSDIDIRCVHMTYLQLSLAGVPAIVKHQNSLTRETWSIWRTPAFMLQYPRFMKYEKYN